MFYLSIDILFFLCVVFIIYLFFLSEIYMFDNIDDAITDPLEKEKIMQFFKTLLSISPNNPACQVNLNSNRIRCLRILHIIILSNHIRYRVISDITIVRTNHGQMLH
jgi:hypothetical protein